MDDDGRMFDQEDWEHGFRVYGVRPGDPPGRGLVLVRAGQWLPGQYADRAAARAAVALVLAGQGAGGRPFLEDIRDAVWQAEGRAVLTAADIPQV